MGLEQMHAADRNSKVSDQGGRGDYLVVKSKVSIVYRVY